MAGILAHVLVPHELLRGKLARDIVDEPNDLLPHANPGFGLGFDFRWVNGYLDQQQLGDDLIQRLLQTAGAVLLHPPSRKRPNRKRSLFF